MKKTILTQNLVRASALYCIIGLFLAANMHAQNPYLDSLKIITEGNQADSIKIDALNALSRSNLSLDLDTALTFANQAKALATKAAYPKGLAYGHKWAGVVYYYRSEWLEALGEWKSAGQIFDSIKDPVGESNILSNIGAIYFNQGAFDKAIENYSKSLKLAEEVGDKLRIATAFLNIGAVYLEKPETYNLALENFTEALSLAKTLDEGEDKQRALGTATLNMGEIYLRQDDYDKAIDFYNQSLQAFNGRDGEPTALIYLSEVYTALDNYGKAQAYQNQAFELALAHDDKLAVVQAQKMMAVTQHKMGKTNQAIQHYKRAIPFAKNLPDALIDLLDIYQGLSSNYNDLSQFDSAYKYQTLAIHLTDTLNKADKRLDILQRDFELERNKIEISRLSLEKELQDQVIQRQLIIQLLVLVGLLSVGVFLYVALRQKKRISKEKHRSEELLLNILPVEVAEELKETGYSVAKHFDEVTVVFTDFKGFVELSKLFTPKELVEELNVYFKAFDEIVTKYKIEKIKTIGDSYMAASGVPTAQDHAVQNAILAAFEMQQFVIARQDVYKATNGVVFSMRVGIHTGAIVAGIVGIKKFQYDMWGDTVNTASRMERHGVPNEVNISQVTYQKVKDHPNFEFVKRDKIEVKGKGQMQMYFVRQKAV